MILLDVSVSSSVTFAGFGGGLTLTKPRPVENEYADKWRSD